MGKPIGNKNDWAKQAARIKEIRLNMRATKNDMLVLANVSDTLYYFWEKGKGGIHPIYLERLEKVYAGWAKLKTYEMTKRIEYLRQSAGLPTSYPVSSQDTSKEDGAF